MYQEVFMKKKIMLVPIFALLLTACELIPIGPNPSSNSSNDETTSFDSQEPSNPSSTSSTSDSEVPTSEIEQTSDVTSLPSTSTSDTPIDPLTSMYNGFSYPLDAKTLATPEYYEFWHPSTKVTIDISASPEIFILMDTYGRNYSEDIDNRYQDLYWPVNVDINVNGKNHSFDEVGMRRKGNTSRNYNFMDGERVSDAISFKLSFNEVWDDDIYQQFGLKKAWTEMDLAYIARDNRTFLADLANKNGLDKIDIKMYKTPDESLVNQPFAFSLFQKYGLIAPNSTLANVHVTSGTNFSDMGVVTINETIDKDLLQRYFTSTNAKGDLYKVGWGKGSEWGDWDKGNLRYEQYLNYPQMIGPEDKYNMYYPRYDAKEYKKYADEAKTIENSPEVAHANLINLMRVLQENEGKSVQEYKAAIETVVDINSFLNFAALSYLTGNQDDIRNNGNNYYIYFNPGENNKAYFIPYDYDWALGLGFPGSEDGGLALADISPFHSKLQGRNREPQDNRLFLYTIIDNKELFNVQVNNQWKNYYYDRLVDIVGQNYYTIDTFNDLFNRYRANYQNDTNVLQMNSSEIYNNFGGTSLFADYVTRVNNAIEKNSPY